MILRQKREYGIYKQLMKMVPGLEERLLEGSEEEILHIADMVCLLPSIKCSLTRKC
jgi:hypothetical protein